MAQELCSHYRILKELGSGGMGTVYLAEDRRLRRNVALKFISSERRIAAGTLRRFKKEARAASSLNHPNVAHIYELGECDGRAFIAMELVEGTRLDAKIGGRPLPATEVVRIALQVADALEAAHARGIVHRDIKPANVMINERGIVKVVDFGLAKLTSQPAPQLDESTLARTEFGAVIGTMPYMSPEQAFGSTVDARSDIFSLGSTIYEMATGVRPFVARTPGELLQKIAQSEPEPMSRLSAGIPSELEAVVQRCLEKQPDRRYQTAGELLADLRGLEQRLGPHGGAIATAPRSRPLPAATSAGKRAIAISAVLAALVAAGSLALWRGKASRAPIDSIAVLPLESSGDADHQVVASGITDGLIDRLSRLPNMRVISSNAVRRYAGRAGDASMVGRELGVRAVLTGRMEQRNGRLNVSMELIDARDDSHLWGAAYQRAPDDILAVQREISIEVSEQLRGRLTPGDRETLARGYEGDPRAYRLYVRGRYFWDRRDRDSLAKAIASYKDAIDIDPAYALAYAGLADCYLFTQGESPPSQAYPLARAAATKALQLDDSLGEAHTTLGFISMTYDYDWAAAERQLLRGLELSPRNPVAHQFYGAYLVARGDNERGLSEARTALALDPFSVALNWNLGWYLFLARRYEDSEAQLRHALELDGRSVLSRRTLARVLLEQGKVEESLDLFEEALAVDRGRDSEFGALSGLAIARLRSGDSGQTRLILSRLQVEFGNRYVPATHIAAIYAALGEHDQAMAWLERGYEQRAFPLFLLRVDPAWDALRADPRFVSLLERVGLHATPTRRVE